MSYAYMMVGATGSGKTYFTKQLIKGVHPGSVMVFDVNDEYRDIYPYEFNPDIDLFLQKVESKRNAIIIIEDATSFFAVQGRNDRMINILTAKRHTHNTIIMLFHSWGDVPRYLYRKFTHIVLFYTLDSERDVLKVGNEKIVEAWNEVQDACKDHPYFKTYPPPKGVAPPSKIYNIYRDVA